MQDNTEVYYAGFAVRLFAWLTDVVIINIPLTIIRMIRLAFSLLDPTNIMVRAFLFRHSLFDIIIYILFTLYFILMTYFYGATLGKTLLHIKVISSENRKPTLWEVFIREVFGRYLSAFIAMIGYLIIIPDKEKRAFHDYIADTRVIYTQAIKQGTPKPPLDILSDGMEIT